MVPTADNDNASGEDQPAGGGGGDGKPCPICGKPVVEAWRPFCSKRCADVDLQRWFSGSYAIPAVEEDAGGDRPFNENDEG